MASLKADLSLCQGYANCLAMAEDYFDIDDDGVVIILNSDVPESEIARVEDAAWSCPASALSVER
jgi:ferredoxin